MNYKIVSLIIIIIIVLSLVYFLIPSPPGSPGGCRKCGEGFANMNSSYPTIGSNMKQIFDTVYIEQATGNLLDITATSSSSSSGTSPGTASSSPSTAPSPASANATLKINGAYGRNGGNSITTSYSVNGTSVANSKTSGLSIDSSYTPYNFFTDDKVQVFVMPWDKETYLAVFDTSVSPPRLQTVVFVPDDGSSMKTSELAATVSINTTNVYNNDNDDRLTTINNYSTTRPVYQVCSNIYFDIANGSMIGMLDRGYNVYERVNPQKTCQTPAPYYIPKNYTKDKPYSPSGTVIADVGDLCAWHVEISDMIALYIGNGRMTMVAVFYMEPNKSVFTLVKCVRFLANGTRDDGTTNAMSRGAYQSGGSGNGMSSADIQAMLAAGKDPYGGMNGWYGYWDKITEGSFDIANGSNYMLKSSYVPPVCPNCPTCNGNSVGVCPNCGGNGGAGSKGADGFSSDTKTPSGPPPKRPSEALADMITDTSSGLRDLLSNTGSGLNSLVSNTGTGLKNIVSDTGSGLKSLTQEVGSGVKGIATGAADSAKSLASGASSAVNTVASGTVGAGRDVVKGATNIGRDIVGGTVGLAEGAGTGAADLARSAGSGAVGLLRDTGSGAKDILYDAAGAIGEGASDLANAFYSPTQPVPTNVPGPAPVQQITNPLLPTTQQQGMTNPPPPTMDGGAGPITGQQPTAPVVGNRLPQMQTSTPSDTTNLRAMGADPMSRFGMLPNTSVSDFIPVTTDFSAFRK